MAAAIALLAVWSGCAPSTTACAPGASQACACTTGEPGAQVCSSDGSGWEECVCDGADDDDATADDDDATADDDDATTDDDDATADDDDATTDDDDVTPEATSTAFLGYAYMYEGCSMASTSIELVEWSTVVASAASTVGDPLKPLGLPLEVGDEYEFNYVRDNWICSLGPGSISNSPVPDTVPSGAYMRGQMVWPWAADWSDWFVAWRYEGVDYVANEVNVVFEEGTTDAYAQLIISGHGGTVVLQTSTSPPTYIVDTTGAATAPGMTLLLLGEPEVTWAEPNPI